jgi:CRISPR-associated protein Cmr4
MSTQLTFVHALSPLHAGTGQGAGVIDLPIAREKATGLPFLPGSSLKGTLRARCTGPECRQIFGPEPTDMQTENNYASSVQFSDQRLLLFPVRSLAGVFAWVTSPYILRRLARDIEDAQMTLPADSIPDIPDENSCAIVNNTSKIKVDTCIYLEDLALAKIQTPAEAGEWASWIAKRVFPDDADWQTTLRERFCIVHDDVFSFLLHTATEITARIKLKSDAKTVEEGGLWYEEALPTETILSGIMLAAPTIASKINVARILEVLQELTNKKTLQFGGKATVGRGLCRVLLATDTKKGSLRDANN